MAAYAATVSRDSLKVHKLGSGGLAILSGTIDVTNYNQTAAEITGITGYFRNAPTVLLGGFSDNGYAVAWDATDKAVKAFNPLPAHNHNLLIIGGRAEGTTDILNATVAGATLGKEEADNVTIVGADSATKGGVVANSVGPSSEVSNDVDVGVVSFIAIGIAP